MHKLDVNTDRSQYMLQGSMIVRMPEANSANWAGWLVVEPRSANKKAETTQCMLGARSCHNSCEHAGTEEQTCMTHSTSYPHVRGAAGMRSTMYGQSICIISMMFAMTHRKIAHISCRAATEVI